MGPASSIASALTGPGQPGRQPDSRRIAEKESPKTAAAAARGRLRRIDQTKAITHVAARFSGIALKG